MISRLTLGLIFLDLVLALAVFREHSFVDQLTKENQDLAAADQRLQIADQGLQHADDRLRAACGLPPFLQPGGGT